MELLTLTSAEAALCASVLAGECYCPEQDGDKLVQVRAELLRRLILGLHTDSASCVTLTGVGIQAEGLHVVGRLNLDAVHSPGGGELCSIGLRNCHFEGGISGRHAHFAHLDLRGSHFTHLPVAAGQKRAPTIDLRGARMETSLQFGRIRPNQTGPLWLSLHGASLQGTLEINGAHFRADDWDDKEDGWSEDRKAALDLTGAEIRGDLAFIDGGVCDGSLRMRGCEIYGDVWLSSARITGGGDEAIFGQSLRVHGIFMLDGRTKMRSEKSELRRAAINGAVSLQNAVFNSDMCISNITLNGDLYLKGVQVGGALELNDIEITSDEDKWYDLTGLWQQVPTRYAHLDAVNALVLIHLSGARAVNLKIQGLRTRRHRALTGKSQVAVTIDHANLDTLVIANNNCQLLLAAADLTCTKDVELTGDFGFIDLHGADIHGSVELDRTDYAPALFSVNQKRHQMPPAVSLSRTTIARRLRVQGEGRQRLLRARRCKLESLRDTELLETLWEIESEKGPARLAQVGFLRRRNVVRVFTGQSIVLFEFIEQNGHSIDTAEKAFEYLRVFCAYVQADDGGFLIIANRDDLDPAIEVDLAATQSQYMEMIKRRVEDDPDSPDDETLETARSLSKIRSIDELPSETWRVEYRERPDSDSRTAAFECCVLYGRSLYRAQFRVKWTEKMVRVEMEDDRLVSPLLSNVPQYRGSEILPVEALATGERWATQPTTPPMEMLSDEQCRRLEQQLQQSLGISGNPIIDLSDARCDTLQDSSGRGWRDPSVIRMNHFVYSKDHRFDDDAPEAPRSAGTFWGMGLRRAYFHWLSRRSESWPFRALARMYRGSTLSEIYRLEVEPYLPDWRARLYWIYRQFSPHNKGQASPSRRNISRANYDPQPFNQAIQVARSRGDYDVAIHFEIAKSKIEWKNFSDANRMWFAILGLAMAAAVLVLTPKHDFNDWTLAIGWAAPIGLLGCYLSSITNAAMDLGFGYLRRPVRAALTMLALLTLGVAGVSFSNREGFLVLDVAPVADLAIHDTRTGELVLGSQLASIPRGITGSSIARDVRCGTNINEPLYALDVLIPLIDLRQESKCEIGETASRREKRAHSPEAGATNRVESLKQLVLKRTIYSPDFWALAKSIYAILGWIVVSLSILTFARVAGSGAGETRT